MRLAIFTCALLAAGAAVAGSVAAGEPTSGTLSVEGAKGLVVLELRGSTLGRLATGTVRVTDMTPRDRFTPLVVGRKLTQERIGPRTVIYRGQGLRFRMLGGGYRLLVRGEGLSLSAVGRGSVVLHGDRKMPTDDAGVFSVAGVDCGEEPEACLPLPSSPERYVLQQPESEPGSTR